MKVVTQNEETRMLAFYREQVNAWLDGDPERRQRLEKMNPTTTTWDAACANFDRDWHRTLLAYENALDPLFDILSDAGRRADLGRVGLVVIGERWGRQRPPATHKALTWEGFEGGNGSSPDPIRHARNDPLEA